MQTDSPTWHHLSNGARSPVWPGILAALAIIGMILIFHHIVRDAVQQAEARHRAITVHAEATWRCKALRVQPMRDSCLVQLNAVPHNGATPQAGSARFVVWLGAPLSPASVSPVGDRIGSVRPPP
jgi:hypothetical protein